MGLTSKIVYEHFELDWRFAPHLLSVAECRLDLWPTFLQNRFWLLDADILESCIPVF